MSALGLELIAWCVAYVVGCVSVWVSYERGAKAWELKFSYTRLLKSGEEHVTSGRWGELFVNTCWLGGVVLIAVFCRDSTISHFGPGKLAVIGLAFVLISIWVLQYSKKVVETERNSDILDAEELKKGYDFYFLFAILFYAGAFVALLKIVNQFTTDVQQFFTSAESLITSQAANIAALGRTVDLSGMLMIERSYIEYNSLNRSIIRQLEPIVMFVIYVMIVLLVVAQTPIRHSFHKDARQIGYYASLFSILLIFLVAAGVYYFQYADFSAEFLQNVQEVVGFDFSDFGYLNRLSAILDEILDFSGFSGFLRIFAEEGGIYIVVLALAQIASSVVSKRVEEMSS